MVGWCADECVRWVRRSGSRSRPVIDEDASGAPKKSTDPKSNTAHKLGRFGPCPLVVFRAPGGQQKSCVNTHDGASDAFFRQSESDDADDGSDLAACCSFTAYPPKADRPTTGGCCAGRSQSNQPCFRLVFKARCGLAEMRRENHAQSRSRSRSRDNGRNRRGASPPFASLSLKPTASPKPRLFRALLCFDRRAWTDPC